MSWLWDSGRLYGVGGPGDTTAHTGRFFEADPLFPAARITLHERGGKFRVVWQAQGAERVLESAGDFRDCPAGLDLDDLKSRYEALAERGLRAVLALEAEECG